MNRNRVFIGYNSNLKRCLLYQKRDGSYIDLETNEHYHNFEILESPLINYNKLVNLTGYSSKERIKEEFQKEEDKIIPLKNIFIVDIYQITDILNKRIQGSPPIEFRIAYTIESKPVFYNKLVEKGRFETYTDLITGEKYNNEFDVKTGDLYIPEQKNTLRPFVQEVEETSTKLPKRNILEKYSSKYNIKSIYQTQ